MKRRMCRKYVVDLDASPRERWAQVCTFSCECARAHSHQLQLGLSGRLEAMALDLEV